MKLENINVEKVIGTLKKQLDEDPNVSPALKSSIELLLIVINILLNHLGLNSSNSSKPPSSDPNRKKKKRKPGEKKPGGQKGHIGSNLEKVKEPDAIEEIKVDRRTIPKGVYKDVGYDSRQIIDIEILRFIELGINIRMIETFGTTQAVDIPEDVDKVLEILNERKS